jgi:hypothetical protein
MPNIGIVIKTARVGKDGQLLKGPDGQKVKVFVNLMYQEDVMKPIPFPSKTTVDKEKKEAHAYDLVIPAAEFSKCMITNFSLKGRDDVCRQAIKCINEAFHDTLSEDDTVWTVPRIKTGYVGDKERITGIDISL